jgi:chitosanase
MPAVNAAANIGLATPLGVAIAYDSTVHGSWQRMRDRTIQAHGRPAGNERAWLSAYVATRRAWLVSMGGLLAKTVYRMDTFRALLDAGNMTLSLPVKAHGIQITDENLGAEQAVVVSAHEDDDVILRLTEPHMTGEGVKALQAALVADGAAISVDGDFGARTEAAVIASQKKHGLKADGVVGPMTRHALGMDKVHGQ